MTEPNDGMSLLLLLVGALVVIAILTKPVARRVGVPALVGYQIIGFALRVADSRSPVLSERAWWVLEFLGTLGLICLLFRVGLDSNLLELGEFAMPRTAYAAMALVALGTGILGPVGARAMLARQSLARQAAS